MFHFIIAVGLTILEFLRMVKRRKAMRSLANQLGYDFKPNHDASLAANYQFLNHMGKGSNRHALNVITGYTPSGHLIRIFDYYYEGITVFETMPKHHYHTVFTIALPDAMPELTVAPEGIFSKVASLIGLETIKFESYEFSNRYRVQSKDKKFAYDFCNAQMMDYLLQHADLAIEVENHVLCIAHHGLLKAELLPKHHEHILNIHRLMPNYLFKSSPPPPLPKSTPALTA